MITVALNERELKKHNACNAGLSVFREFLKTGDLRYNQTLIVEWSPLAYLLLARAYPNFCNWLCQEGLIPRLSLSGANLSGANLSGANLSGANLSGANLYGVDLRGWELTPSGYVQRRQGT